MRPSKIDSLRGQASGVNRLPVPGTRNSDALIGSTTPRRCASVSGTRFGIGSAAGSATNSRTTPPLIAIRTSSYFLSVKMLDAVGRRERIARPRSCRARRSGRGRWRSTRISPAVWPLADGGKMIVRDVDDPAAASDRNAREGEVVAGVELALGARRRRIVRATSGTASCRSSAPDRVSNAAGRQELAPASTTSTPSSSAVRAIDGHDAAERAIRAKSTQMQPCRGILTRTRQSGVGRGFGRSWAARK